MKIHRTIRALLVPLAHERGADEALFIFPGMGYEGVPLWSGCYYPLVRFGLCASRSTSERSPNSAIRPGLARRRWAEVATLAELALSYNVGKSTISRLTA
jgi:hypothetical protein